MPARLASCSLSPNRASLVRPSASRSPPRQPPIHSGLERLVSASSSTAPLPSADALVTEHQVADILRSRGLQLVIHELGPFYRVICRDDTSDKVVGWTTGWIWPVVNVMHCESLQVFTRNMRSADSQRIRGGPLGLGVLIGCATFAYGLRKGCSKGEILAINDDDHQHARLVKYYTYFGFTPVKVVGENGLADLPDQVVWGGVGTRMDADLAGMLAKWSPALLRRWHTLHDGSQEHAEPQ